MEIETENYEEWWSRRDKERIKAKHRLVDKVAMLEDEWLEKVRKGESPSGYPELIKYWQEKSYLPKRNQTGLN